MHHITYIDGIDVSATLISRISDKILPEIREWQNGYLKSLYAIRFIAAIHFPVRTDGMVK